MISLSCLTCINILIHIIILSIVKIVSLLCRWVNYGKELLTSNTSVKCNSDSISVHLDKTLSYFCEPVLTLWLVKKVQITRLEKQKTWVGLVMSHEKTWVPYLRHSVSGVHKYKSAQEWRRTIKSFTKGVPLDLQ
jgi:hypothetical protein